MTAAKPNPKPQLLRIPETAARLNCSRDHVYDLVAAGELETVDIGLKAPLLRVVESSVDQLIAARTKTVPLAAS